MARQACRSDASVRGDPPSSCLRPAFDQDDRFL